MVANLVDMMAVKLVVVMDMMWVDLKAAEKVDEKVALMVQQMVAL